METHIVYSVDLCSLIFSFMCMFCRSLFVLFLMAIVLSVILRYTDSDYLFGIFKLFFISLEPTIINSMRYQTAIPFSKYELLAKTMRENLFFSFFFSEFQAFVGIENINHAKQNPKWVWDISGLPMANDMLARRLQTDNGYCMIAVYNMFRDNSFKAGLQNVPCNHLFKPLCQIKMTSRWCLYFYNVSCWNFLYYVWQIKLPATI